MKAKSSRGPLKDYISFDETLRAYSISGELVGAINRYISRTCNGTQMLDADNVLSEANRYIDSNIEPVAVREARNFVNENLGMRKNMGGNEQIDAYVKKRAESRTEIRGKLISGLKEKPVETFAVDLGDFIIAGSSKSAQQSSV